MNARMATRNTLSTLLLSSSLFVAFNATAAVLPVGGGGAACNADCTAEGVNFTADGILTVADGVNIGATAGASATADNPNEGTMTFAGSSNVAGTVGTGNAIKNMNLTGAGTVVLNGAASANTKVDVQMGTLQFLGDISTSDLTVAAGATLDVGASKLITGPVTNGGTLNLNANTLNIIGTLASPAASTIATTVGASSGTVTTTAAATVNAGSTLAVTLGGSVADGTVITVINDGSGGGAVNVPGTVTGGNATYTLSAATENGAAAGDTLLLTVNRNSLASSSGTNTALAGVSGALDGLVGTSGPLAPLLLNVESQPNAAAIEQVLLTISPTSDGSIFAPATQSVLSGMHIVNHRMDNLRVAANSASGYAAGDMSTANAGWVQMFGSDMDQDNRSGFPGYDAWNAGLALGFDHEFTDDILLGVGFSYAYTDVETKHFTNSKVNIHSYQGIVYGSWEPMDPWYVDAFMSIAYHDYNSVRNIIIPAAGAAPGFNLRADGEFGAWQFTTAFETGYDWRYDNWLVTPHISLRYSHMNVGALQEFGAGPLNLYTNYDDVDEFTLGGGVRGGYLFEMENNVVAHPYAFAQVFHDFINDSQGSASNFVGGGTNFITPGLEPDDTMFRVGAGVDFACIDRWMLSFNYAADFKSDYFAHGGFLKARLEWN